MRSTGSWPAARMLRRISSSGARRRPSLVSSSRRHAVDVVGADGQRDLRELRAVERPVDLDRRDVVDDQPRQRDALHVVVAGRRHGRIDRARQRRERADDADVVLQLGDLLEQRGSVGRRQLVDREPRQREAGDVDLLDRAARIAAADRTAPRRRARGRPRAAPRAARAASRRSRAASCFEIGERERRRPATPSAAAATSRDARRRPPRGSAARRRCESRRPRRARRSARRARRRRRRRARTSSACRGARGAPRRRACRG